ncbi:MAG: isochorismatase family protein [Planctomycetota bacterium]|nr:isochorismatase family protein [Planctomycetota bacterium]
MENINCDPLPFGSEDLQMSESLRIELRRHLADLKEKYLQRGWGTRMGWGTRPAVIVIDLANYWLRNSVATGSTLDSVVEATVSVLDAARRAGCPILFTTLDWDPAFPETPQNRKLKWDVSDDGEGDLFELDDRLNRQPDEMIIRKRFASAFKGTALSEILASLDIDTLVVCGVSTSHCVYATCRDAVDSMRVIVPEEAVGERCEVMHTVNLLDMDIDIADVTPLEEVLAQLAAL